MADESTLHHRLAPSCSGGAAHGRWGPAATKRRTSDFAEAFQRFASEHAEGLSAPLGELGEGDSFTTLCHLQHGPIPSRGPSMRGTITTKWRHQGGIATDGPLPAASPHKSRGRAGGGHLKRRQGPVVCASPCWGTTCPSGPTASRATRHHALSTIFARREQACARARQGVVTKCVRTLPAARHTAVTTSGRCQRREPSPAAEYLHDVRGERRVRVARDGRQPSTRMRARLQAQHRTGGRSPPWRIGRTRASPMKEGMLLLAANLVIKNHVWNN